MKNKVSKSEKSCGMALVKEFKNLGQFQFDNQKAEYVAFIEHVFNKYNTPKEYAEEMLTNIKKMSVKNAQTYICNVILAGCGMRSDS